jgi:predicted phosphohydrolase
MALFVISDLHLSFSSDKPMNVFGWDNYEEKLENNWRNNVNDDDTVIIPGDISWAMYLDEARLDFEFINNLPGKKIILKGNHDYWWTTVKKMNEFVQDNGFYTINFLFNNSFSYKNYAICGTRGWGNNGTTDEDTRIWNREIQRLLLSIGSSKGDIICCLHYPPTNLRGGISEDYIDIFKKYNVKQVCYGHLHGNHELAKLPDEIDGIRFSLVSCDFLNFMPFKLSD